RPANRCTGAKGRPANRCTGAKGRPANRCTGAKGRTTMCNRDLATWLNDYATALDKANQKLKAILGLQPKP
ncbi:MAG: hypothetical protein WKF61_04815, partial [Luteimonas sp.]